MHSAAGFTETDPANFSGSYYSLVKAQAESLVLSAYASNTLMLRLRMPVSDDLHPRSFVTKITNYAFVVDVPNSNTILHDLLPCSIKLAEESVTGIFNFTNPGTISHNEVLSLYKQYVDPQFKWRNFTLEQQSRVMKAGRSNCALDSTKLVRKMREYGIEVPEVHRAYVECFERMSQQLPSSFSRQIQNGESIVSSPLAQSRREHSCVKARPFLLFVCHPLAGHLAPMIRIAEALQSRGWSICFLGSTTHRARIVQTGVEFMSLIGEADLDDLAYYDPTNPHPPVPGYWDMHWPARALVDMKVQVLDLIPAQWASVKAALQMLYERDPLREVVVVSEAMFHGILPLCYGAPLPPGVRRPRTAVVSVTVPLIRSVDLPPFGFPLPFDQSAEGRARNAACWTSWASQSAELSDLLSQKLSETGCARSPGQEVVALSGINYLSHDMILQLGVPGLYYPRSDWPASFEFTGIIPAATAPAAGWPDVPPWWKEVTATEHRKKVVVVAQGTVEVDPNELILPTIRAMADRKDVLVVGILGREGTTLPQHVEVPANARLIDFLHYDAILPHAHAWVHNGGYGAVQHGISHGLPMVVGGEGQDKTENRRRVAFSGAGVDLGTARPTEEQVQSGIEAVLSNPSYRQRARELRKEAQNLDCFQIVEKAMLTLSSS